MSWDSVSVCDEAFNEASDWLKANGYEVGEWCFNGISIIKGDKSVTVDCISSFYAVCETLKAFNENQDQY